MGLQQSFLFTANSGMRPERERVNLVRLQHPILRSITTSREDLGARFRCIDLLLFTVGQMNSAEAEDDLVFDMAASHTDSNPQASEPALAPGDKGGARPSSKRDSEPYTILGRSAIRRKLRDQTTLLQSLATANDGASCKVFWDLWDEIFVVLAESVSLATLTAAHEGRMFTPSSDAAVYIESATTRRPTKYHCSPYGEEFGPSRAGSISSSVFTHPEPVSPTTNYAFTPVTFSSEVHDVIGFQTYDFDSDQTARKNLRQQLLDLDDNSLLSHFEK